jgi:hypothetical protein
MSESLSIELHNRVQAWAAIKAQVFPFLATVLQGGGRWVLQLKPQTRNLPQNAKLHAMLGEIASQKEWAGKKRDTDTWKRLMVAAWCRAKGEAIEFLPAIDGQGVDIVFKRTSELDKAECAELIEFVYAWAAQSGVELSQ